MQVVQGTYVEGMKEEVVLSPGHALSFIAAGEGTFEIFSSCLLLGTKIVKTLSWFTSFMLAEHRHVGSNNFNLFSSRSHTIFSLVQLAFILCFLYEFLHANHVLSWFFICSSCHVFAAALLFISFPGSTTCFTVYLSKLLEVLKFLVLFFL